MKTANLETSLRHNYILTSVPLISERVFAFVFEDESMRRKHLEVGFKCKYVVCAL